MQKSADQSTRIRSSFAGYKCAESDVITEKKKKSTRLIKGQVIIKHLSDSIESGSVDHNKDSLGHQKIDNKRTRNRLRQQVT